MRESFARRARESTQNPASCRGPAFRTCRFPVGRGRLYFDGGGFGDVHGALRSSHDDVAMCRLVMLNALGPQVR